MELIIEDKIYEVKGDDSGIDLNSFDLSREKALEAGIEIEKSKIKITFKVEKIIQYRPWNFGKDHPGAGQVGIYQLKGSDYKTYYAVIKDYRYEGKIYTATLLMIDYTEQKIKNRLMVNPIGYTFLDYIFENKKYINICLKEL